MSKNRMTIRQIAEADHDCPEEIGPMSEERVIGRDRIGRKITIFTYEDGGRIFYDLQTDGRILLTTKLAKKLADELMLFAGGNQ